MKKKLSALLLTVLLCLSAIAVSADGGVIINQVYGHGEKEGAYVSHCFVELYNTSDSPISLKGWSLQYAKGNKEFSEAKIYLFSSEDVIEGRSSLLIRGLASVDKKVTLNITRGTERDIEGAVNVKCDISIPDFKIDNSQVQLALVKSFKRITGSKDPNVVDFLGAAGIDDETGEAEPVLNYLTAPLLDISKKRAARRECFANTGDNSKDFDTFSYDNPLEEIEIYRPRSKADGTWDNKPVIMPIKFTTAGEKNIVATSVFNSENDMNLLLVVSVYDAEGKLKSVTTNSAKVNKGEKEKIDVDAESILPGYKIKAGFYNTKEGFAPLADLAEYEVK